MQQTQLQWVADRAQLRILRLQNPTLSIAQLIKATGHCRNWVKKSLARFKLAASEDQTVLWDRSPLHPLIVERILAIRHDPPANLKRIPGPKTIAYYLQKDPLLLEHGLKPPSSTSTI
ncbi:MAG TPA: hypothetical protein VH186_09840 [Chloroflexia bacterium]|nr:hypothetical protein [Chloroflexia bacterium]